MVRQKSDLISSRACLEAEGERFGCFRCGEPLQTVALGGASDLCEPCDEAVAEAEAAADL